MQNKHIFFFLFFLIFLLSYALQIFSRLNELKHIFFVKKSPKFKRRQEDKIDKKKKYEQKICIKKDCQEIWQM